MTLEQLLALRAEKFNKMQELNAKDSLTADEASSFDTLKAEFDSLDRKVLVAKTDARLSGEIDDILTANNTDVEIDSATNSLEYVKGFDTYLQTKGFSDAQNAMTVGVDADGGYIVPEVYQNTVIQKLNILGRTRAISNVLGTANTTNIPTEGDAPTFAWIDEEGAYGETKSTFGKVQLKAYKLGGIIKVSEELLKDTNINFDSYMANQIAKGIDKAEAPAFAIGDGTGKPTGYTVGATVGASSTTAAVAAVTADELIDIFYDLKEEYRGQSTWRMTDKTEKAVRKLKDGEGNYLWSAALMEGERPTLLGRPIVIDNSMAELGTGNKFIVIGDFTSYQIADRGSMSIQRLDELYAANGFVGFKVTKRVDAKVVLPEAFNAGQNA